MAEVQLATALQRQGWSTEVTTEYVRESGLLPYMGPGENSIIRVRLDHKEQKGDIINFPLVTRIKGRGVRGSEVLKGNEADLGLANTAVRVDWIRNGVKLPKSTTFRTALDMYSLSKPQLQSWSAELLRDETLSAMNSIIVPGTVDAQGLPGTDTQVIYSLSSAAQRNTFLAQNSDRIVFGNARANISSGNFATSLGNISIATGLSSAVHLGLLKAIARAAGQVAPAASTTGFTTNIRPYKSAMTQGREYFVYFCGSREFNALKFDASILSLNTNARAREGGSMDDNPVFQGGDLIFDGIIIREVPEIDNFILVGAGAGGADIAPAFLCGQSSICVGYGMKPEIQEDLTEDYNFRPGMAITELRGIAKTSFAGVQYGIVTSMVAVSPLT